MHTCSSRRIQICRFDEPGRVGDAMSSGGQTRDGEKTNKGEEEIDSSGRLAFRHSCERRRENGVSSSEKRKVRRRKKMGRSSPPPSTSPVPTQRARRVLEEGSVTESAPTSSRQRREAILYSPAPHQRETLSSSSLKVVGLTRRRRERE